MGGIEIEPLIKILSSVKISPSHEKETDVRLARIIVHETDDWP